MDLDTKLERLVNYILDKKGSDIISIDIRHKTTIADFFVICSGGSELHIKAIADYIIEQSKNIELRVFGVEGLQNAKWVLIDLGEIIVHVFSKETRDYYKLEDLWKKK